MNLRCWVAVLLSHLRPPLLATILHLDVSVNVACTFLVAVAIIIPLMYPLWTHEHNTNFFICLSQLVL